VASTVVYHERINLESVGAAELSARIPAALVSGRMDASVGAMAANTLTASALAADAVTEVQSGLATTANVSAVETDTQDIQGRLPATLTGGRMDASVGAMAANTLTASALAADAVAEIQSGLSTLAAGAAMTLTAGERDSIAAALLDLANSIETGLTVRQALRIVAAAEAGKVSGGGTTTIVIRNAVQDSKARLTATVDSDGNRSAITYDLT
jgi:hypothetical protein